MLEQGGPLPRLALSPTLWLVLVGPLVAFAYLMLVSRGRLRAAASEAATKAELATTRVVGLTGVLAASSAVLAQTVWLVVRTRGQGARLDHVLRGARLPGLEGPLDLWLDRRAAVACVLACAVAVGSAVVLARSPESERGWAPWAWLELALLGALAAFLADSLPLVVVGWSLVGCAGAWLQGWGDARRGFAAAPKAAVAVCAVVVGASLLFWGMGGGWDELGFVPSEGDALAAVRARGNEGESTLTMTAPPGARVVLDDAHDASLRVPFVRAPVAAGTHVVRVEARGGEVPSSARALTVAAGQDVAIVALGPTLSIHAMADALALPDEGALPGPRRRLESRAAPGGVSIVASTLLALLVAMVFLASLRPGLAAPRPLAAFASAVAPAALGPFLLARLDFLLPSAHAAGAVVALVGAALFLWTVWQALAYLGLARALVFATGAPTALACMTLGLRGASSGVAAMAVAGVAAAGAHLYAARFTAWVPERAIAEPPPIDDGEGADMLTAVPEHAGELLLGMERWVLGAALDAAAASVRITAWVAAVADRHLVTTPFHHAADKVIVGARAVEPLTGARVGRVAWILLAAAALAVLLHALWPGG